jgi:hypothetical protein
MQALPISSQRFRKNSELVSFQDCDSRGISHRANERASSPQGSPCLLVRALRSFYSFAENISLPRREFADESSWQLRLPEDMSRSMTTRGDHG